MGLFGTKQSDQANASEIAATNIAKRQYQKEYLDYWNGTQDLTGTGRPVDAFIMPLAPFATARPNGFSYYGYTMILNTLDYTACTIPVTNVDQSVDMMDTTYKAMNEQDQVVVDDCMSTHLFFFQKIALIFPQMIPRYMTELMLVFSLLVVDCKRKRYLP